MKYFFSFLFLLISAFTSYGQVDSTLVIITAHDEYYKTIELDSSFQYYVLEEDTVNKTTKLVKTVLEWEIYDEDFESNVISRIVNKQNHQFFIAANYPLRSDFHIKTQIFELFPGRTFYHDTNWETGGLKINAYGNVQPKQSMIQLYHRNKPLENTFVNAIPSIKYIGLFNTDKQHDFIIKAGRTTMAYLSRQDGSYQVIRVILYEEGTGKW